MQNLEAAPAFDLLKRRQVVVARIVVVVDAQAELDHAVDAPREPGKETVPNLGSRSPFLFLNLVIFPRFLDVSIFGKFTDPPQLSEI